MLGRLALKRRWQQRRRAADKSTESPNTVMWINVQICWEKFCTYFEVEPRYVPRGLADTLPPKKRVLQVGTIS
jgi:glutamate decarboxylase